MAEEKKASKRNYGKKQMTNRGGTGSAYILAMIGAAAYYVQIANGSGEVIVALLKALVWPAFLVYELLKFIVA